MTTVVPVIATVLPEGFMSEEGTAPRAARLTRTELQVVRLISLGCSVKEAAAVLGRSVHTVDNHKTRAMRKLGIHNAAALTRCAIVRGISPLEDQLTSEEQALVAQARVANAPDSEA